MIDKGKIRESMRLYAVTDSSWLEGRSLVDCVADALEGGVTCVQFREKNKDSTELEVQAKAIRALCNEAGVPFIVNDAVGFALHVRADGVHLGKEDMAPAKARQRIGSSRILGISVQTVEEARSAEDAGADYLGVGAVFGTSTKPEATLVDRETLKAICDEVTIPVVAIGGLNTETIPQLQDSGIDGVALVSAIFAADDIKRASQDLRRAVDAIVT